jgi:uncharacterized cupredoxin-like copper-binding protein
MLVMTAVGALTLALAGCGGDSAKTETQAVDTSTSSEQTTSSTTTSAPAGTTALTVTMTDFAFTPKNPTVPAGPVTLTAPNEGRAPHELVLIKFAGDPGTLPTKADGDADEDAFPESALPGEIGETEPGSSGTLTITLPAGKYVMLCNVPAHYKAGMYGTLTVT